MILLIIIAGIILALTNMAILIIGSVALALDIGPMILLKWSPIICGYLLYRKHKQKQQMITQKENHYSISQPNEIRIPCKVIKSKPKQRRLLCQKKEKH